MLVGQYFTPRELQELVVVVVGVVVVVVVGLAA
jgi:hypothetical protein